MSARPSIEPYLPQITRKCQQVARFNEGYVTVEDLVQEVALWWYSIDATFLAAYLADHGMNRLYRSVFRVAKAAADKERRAAGPTDVFVQARYSPVEVLKLLPVALDPDGLPDGGGSLDSGPKAHNNKAEGGDILASLIDVRRGLDSLDPDDHGYLTHIDRLRWDYERAAEQLGVAPDSVRRRTARLAEKIANWLNNEETE